MDEAQTLRTALRDAGLPSLPTMLGPDAVDMLTAALPASHGTIRSARPAQVSWQPGRSLAVVYDVKGKGRGIPRQLVAWAGKQVPEAPVVLGRDDERVALWEPSGDPDLPGLSIATDEAQTRRLLDSLDVSPGRVRRRIRSYRPRNRAVVAWSTGSTALYAKIVPPASVEALQARHRAVAPHLPVPRSHGWSPEHGLVVLEAIPGVTLRAAFADTRIALPQPAELAAVLDRIPDPGDGGIARSPVDVAAHHARMIGRLVPDLRDRTAELAAGIEAAGDPGPLVPVHGDFYEAQLLMNRGHIAGVLDIDTVALGHRVDDWAVFIGHLALQQDALAGPARQRLRNYGRALIAHADREVDPRRLRAGIAAVILGLATGPFRVQTPNWPEDTRRRITLAEHWLESASRLGFMREPSFPSQTGLTSKQESEYRKAS